MLCANLAHELVVEMNVVLPEQLPAERLARLRQVMQIGARVARAGRAGASRIEFLLGEFVNAAAHLQKPARSENGAALRQLRRHDAIEHVHAAMDGFENIERRADAHEIARLVLRQKLRGEFAHVLALALALADREPADGESVEWHFAQASRAFPPQFLEERALHDPEHRLRRIAARRQTPRRPAMRDIERGPRRRFIRGRGDALIERHHDVAADRLLRLDADFRAEQDRLPVEVTLKNRALLAHRRANAAARKSETRPSPSAPSVSNS